MTQLNIFNSPKVHSLIQYISANANLEKPVFAWIDLFCGCGGVTEGYSQVENNFVVACVNHDPSAIESHYLNHPESIHYTEDIKIRPLTVQELKESQGFPQDYYLVDGVIKAKKQIGNSVVPIQAKVNCQALYDAYCSMYNK